MPTTLSTLILHLWFTSLFLFSVCSADHHHGAAEAASKGRGSGLLVGHLSVHDGVEPKVVGQLLAAEHHEGRIGRHHRRHLHSVGLERKHPVCVCVRACVRVSATQLEVVERECYNYVLDGDVGQTLRGTDL